MTAPTSSRSLEPGRVAEVMVSAHGGEPGGRGSGYLVGDRWILTTAHTVRTPGATVTVRFDADLPGQWVSPTRVLLLADAADVALLEMTGAKTPRPSVASPRYGLVPDADLVLPCSAMGFPRFKLRDPRALRPFEDGTPGPYRDSCHATGTISVLSNRREGTLDFAVAAPDRCPDPGHSPWEGMSGAAVWHDGAVIGLVRSHHHADGPGHLAVARVDRWFDLLTADELRLLRHAAGFPEGPDGLFAPGSAPTPHGSLVGLPDSVPLRELDGLVTALTALPVIRDRSRLDLVLQNIDPVIAANAPRDAVLRVDVFGIVKTCLSYPGTLDALLETVRLIESGSSAAARLDRAVAELMRRQGSSGKRAVVSHTPTGTES